MPDATPSVRERILRHLLAISAAALPAANVARTRTLPASKDQTLMVRLFADSEQVEGLVGNRVQRTLTVNFKLFTRGATPDELADGPLTDLASAIVADPRLGGLATQIVESALGWDFDSEVSEDYSEVTAAFLITYNTARDNPRELA